MISKVSKDELCYKYLVPQVQAIMLNLFDRHITFIIVCYSISPEYEGSNIVSVVIYSEIIYYKNIFNLELSGYLIYKVL